MISTLTAQAISSRRSQTAFASGQRKGREGLDIRGMEEMIRIGRVMLIAALIASMAGCGGFAGRSGNLHRAASDGDVERVKALVKKGAVLDAPGEGGATALHEAAYCGRYAVVAFLIEHGADPEAVDNLSRTPLYYAQETTGGSRKCSGASSIEKDSVAGLLSSRDAVAGMRETGRWRGRLDAALASGKPSALRDYIAWDMGSDLKPEAEAALAGLEEKAWKQSHGSIEALSGFLREYPASIQRPEALRMMLKHAGGQDRRTLRSLAAEFNDITAQMPPEERLWYIGPPGLSVDEIAAMLKAGVSEGFIVNRIEASGARYRVFTPEESARLLEMGIPQPVQDAMQNSTRLASEPAASAALRAEIESLRARLPGIVSMNSAGGVEGSIELAANCSARLAALEACRDRTSGAPRQNACMSAAKTQFRCQR